MATKSLNRPASWQKQVNPNTKRMKQLMRDVRANVERRTRNCKDLDTWMEKLSDYVGANCFSTGIHATDAMDIVKQIAGVVDQTSLPSGSNAEILKGTMAEACYTMVTKVGDDIRNELRQIAVNGYNERLTPQQLAREMGAKIDSLSRSRCQAIARTETCRAANIGNYINAKEMGAKSYSVICNEGCCEYCQEAYGTDESGGVGEVIFDIEDTDSLPPFHPNCRCTPVWSMDPVPGSETDDLETTDDEINLNDNMSSIIEIPGLETPEIFQETIKNENKGLYNMCKRHDCFDEAYNILRESQVSEFELKNVQIMDIARMRKDDLKEYIQWTDRDLFDEIGGYDVSWKKFCEAYDLMYTFSGLEGRTIIDDEKVLDAVCQGINEQGYSICYAMETKSKNKQGGKSLMLAIDF